jgi:hypothetical protein
MHRSTHVLGLLGIAATIMLIGVLLGMGIEKSLLHCVAR